MKTRFKTMGIALFAAAAFSLRASAEPVLAGNAAFSGQALDAEAVKAVLLGKRVTVGDVRVTIVIAKSSAAQEKFLTQAVGMTTSQFQNHWRRLFMTGGGSAPKIVESDAEAAKLAAETAGAVAMIEDTKADGLAVLSSGK